MYYFIEDNGYAGLDIIECETKKCLAVAISKSKAGIPHMLIEGREIKMKWKRDKRTACWDKSKRLDIPELGVHAFGKPIKRNLAYINRNKK